MLLSNQHKVVGVSLYLTLLVVAVMGLQNLSRVYAVMFEKIAMVSLQSVRGRNIVAL